MDTNLFFPDVGGKAAQADISEAKAACSRCPVREECLAEATRFESAGWTTHGVWAGMSGRERRVYRRGLVRDEATVEDQPAALEPAVEPVADPVPEPVVERELTPDPVPEPSLCGTVAGWVVHQEAKERPCTACVMAKGREHSRQLAARRVAQLQREAERQHRSARRPLVKAVA